MTKRVKLEIKVDDEGNLKNPVGRPKGMTGLGSKYKPEFAKQAHFLCSRGATDDILADAFSVNVSTIRDWQSSYEDFGNAVRQGKAEIFDPLVERALAQRALGYSVDVVEIKYVGKEAMRREDIVRKHYPPDTTACIFWLKNRQPGKWRDVYDHNHSGELENKTATELFEDIKKDVQELGLSVDRFEPKIKGLVPPKGSNGKTKH